MRKKTIILVISCIILSLLSSCGNKEEAIAELDVEYLSKVMQGIEYQTATVKTGTLKEQVKEEHMMVIPRHYQDFKFHFDGVINDYYFQGNKLINKGELIAELDTTKIEEEIMMQKFQVERERIIYDQLKEKGGSEKQIKVQELEVKIQEEKLGKLEKDKELHKIYAPVDCYITSYTVPKHGKFKAGQTLFTVAHIVDPIIKSSKVVNMNKFENINIGDSVNIKLKSGNYKGKVSFISYEMGKEAIYITLDDEMEKALYYKLGPDAIFETKEIRNKLLVPKVAIKRNGQQRYVEILKDSVKKIRFINCGTEGKDGDGIPCYEVLSGLKDGDEVILKKKSIFDKMK